MNADARIDAAHRIRAVRNRDRRGLLGDWVDLKANAIIAAARRRSETENAAETVLPNVVYSFTTNSFGRGAVNSRKGK
jgi:hypothetical protein